LDRAVIIILTRRQEAGLEEGGIRGEEIGDGRLERRF
jgi:hypothetical protein